MLKPLVGPGCYIRAPAVMESAGTVKESEKQQSFLCSRLLNVLINDSLCLVLWFQHTSPCRSKCRAYCDARTSGTFSPWCKCLGFSLI